MLQHRTRTLNEWVLVCFHQACDQRDLDAAARLISVLDGMLMRRQPGTEAWKRELVTTIAAHERFWHLRRTDPRPVIQHETVLQRRP
jgi:hypothetical protein